MKKRKYPELRALKGKIREENKTYRGLAHEIGMGVNTLNDKLNGYSVLNTDEVNKIVEKLNIENKDIVKYFFPHMLRKATNGEESAAQEVI